ncbi:MAG: hypothetical protein IAF94_24395, partial [Pirellulaceae bacterium]|nr:hypothetical protein [Pirellulaceae bacterium]
PAETLPAATDPALPPPATAPVPVPLPPLGIDFSVPLGGTPRITVPALGPAPLVFEFPGESPENSDEAALLAEIKQLQDKLHSLEAKRGAKYLPVPKGAAANAGGNKIAITRADGEGKLWTEIWTTDETGKPSKIISKTAVAGDAAQPAQLAVTPDGKVIVKQITDKDGSPRLYLIDAATGKILGTAPSPVKVPQDSPDWKAIVKEVVDKDGVRRHYWLDAATGKVIESVPAPAKGEPTIEWRPTPSVANPNDPQKPDAPRTNTGRRSELRFPTPIMPAAPTASAPVYEHIVPVARPAGEPNMARGAQQLDLVSLATSYADAVGVLEAAQAKADEHGKLSGANVISQQEVTTAKLALSAARRKEQILRNIAEVATHSAAEDFERTSQLHKAGQTTASAATEAKTRMEILKQILGMRPAESAPKN